MAGAFPPCVGGCHLIRIDKEPLHVAILMLLAEPRISPAIIVIGDVVNLAADPAASLLPQLAPLYAAVA